MIRLSGVSAVVTDIEGTTGSIAFVHEVLFPYARSRLASVVGRHEAAAPIAEIKAAEGEMDDRALLALLNRWMDEDRKAAPMKTLQGLIWRGGYETGELKGHVYDDAVRALRKWRAAGVDLYVYSSGSEEAQKLLFRHSTAGDLSDLFSGYFDTRVGAKSEPASYVGIAGRIGATPGAILFLSDSQPEVFAAASAGLRTVRLVREGRPDLGEAATFDDIALA